MYPGGRSAEGGPAEDALAQLGGTDDGGLGAALAEHGGSLEPGDAILTNRKSISCRTS